MLSPVRWYGGKFYLRRYILKYIDCYFNDHDSYTELFAGGISILLAKEPVKNEVINDLDTDLINFYIALRDNYLDLMDIIEEFEYSRESFELSKRFEYKVGLERTALIIG